VALAALVAGCSYNHIVFEEGSVALAEQIEISPGSAGDDTGATGGPVAGGAGKQSPGGSNLVDGYLNLTMMFQQGGETPTKVDAKAAATVQSPNSQAGTGGETGASVGEKPKPPE
jgi:hypothetical protein